jgi:hypothetical protein
MYSIPDEVGRGNTAFPMKYRRRRGIRKTVKIAI